MNLELLFLVFVCFRSWLLLKDASVPDKNVPSRQHFQGRLRKGGLFFTIPQVYFICLWRTASVALVGLRSIANTVAAQPAATWEKCRLGRMYEQRKCPAENHRSSPQGAQPQRRAGSAAIKSEPGGLERRAADSRNASYMKQITVTTGPQPSQTCRRLHRPLRMIPSGADWPQNHNRRSSVPCNR